MNTPFKELVLQLKEEFGRDKVSVICVNRKENVDGPLGAFFKEGFIHEIYYRHDTLFITSYKFGNLNFCIIDSKGVSIATVYIDKLGNEEE